MRRRCGYFKGLSRRCLLPLPLSRYSQMTESARNAYAGSGPSYSQQVSAKVSRLLLARLKIIRVDRGWCLAGVGRAKKIPRGRSLYPSFRQWSTRTKNCSKAFSLPHLLNWNYESFLHPLQTNDKAKYGRDRQQDEDFPKCPSWKGRYIISTSIKVTLEITQVPNQNQIWTSQCCKFSTLHHC